MPISNKSQTWPKILICSTCKQPVERMPLGTFKVREHHYSCPTCNVYVPKEDTTWISADQALQVAGPEKATTQEVIQNATN